MGKRKNKNIGMPCKYIPPKKNRAINGGMKNAEGVFANCSILDLLGGMEYILSELNRRGVKVVDFEQKDRVLQMIRPIGKDFCFLAAVPDQEKPEESSQEECYEK